MKKNRKWNKAYAAMMGYFWLPCAKCGEYHGGHEWTHSNVGIRTDRPGQTRGICDDCAEEIMARHPDWTDIILEPETFEESERNWMDETYLSRDGVTRIGLGWKEV